MKRTVLLTVMLSGLGAGAMAAPISIAYRPSSDSLLSQSPIETDLDLPAPSLRPDIWDDDFTAEPEPEDSPADSIPWLDNHPSGSQQVPEPPPVTLLLVGLAVLSIGTQLRRRKTVHYRRGRRLTILR